MVATKSTKRDTLSKCSHYECTISQGLQALHKYLCSNPFMWDTQHIYTAYSERIASTTINTLQIHG